MRGEQQSATERAAVEAAEGAAAMRAAAVSIGAAMRATAVSSGVAMRAAAMRAAERAAVEQQ